MDLSSIMEQARNMQEKMAKIQQDLASKTITGSAGGGMVTVTVNGKADILSINIEQAVIDPDEKDMLQDLIVAATNDAVRRARELGKEEMAQLTGGLNIPGISNILNP
ncbi:YbaB/EbfC family nucleoid-associated protein [Desulfomarina sp.]